MLINCRAEVMQDGKVLEDVERFTCSGLKHVYCYDSRISHRSS